MTNTQKFAKQELDILAATVPECVLSAEAINILTKRAIELHLNK